MSYKKLAQDVKPGMVILCADGTISFTVLACDVENGLVKCRCENSAVLGERKNVNLPGVVVDLPTLTEKDKEDILQWGVPNKIDMIALSFVRKGSDLIEVRKLLGKHTKNILLMSKVLYFPQKLNHNFVQMLIKPKIMHYITDLSQYFHNVCCFIAINNALGSLAFSKLACSLWNSIVGRESRRCGEFR